MFTKNNNKNKNRWGHVLNCRKLLKGEFVYVCVCFIKSGGVLATWQ